MSYAHINLESMSRLITVVRNAKVEFGGIRDDLRGSLERCELETHHPNPLSHAAVWCDRIEPDLVRRLALAEARMAGQALGVNTVEIDESELGQLSPAQARALAADLADALSREGTLTPEQVEALLVNAADPYFAREFAHGTTPLDIAGLARTYELNFLDGRTDAEEYERQLQALGTVVGTATRAMEGDEAETYARAVAQILTGVPDPQSRPSTSGGRTSRGGSFDFPSRRWLEVEEHQLGQDGALAMSAVLSYASVSPEFGELVAGAVIDVARDADPASEAAAVAQQWSAQQAMYASAGRFTLPDGTAREDTLTGIMAMLGNSPAAAQRVFSTGGTTPVWVSLPVRGGVEQVALDVNERLKFITLEHRWPEPGLGGDGYRRAIEAATTVFRNREASGRSSAEIATQFFMLAGAPELGGGDTQQGESFDMAVAMLLASYMPDVYRVFGESGRPDQDIPAGMVMEEDWRFGDSAPYGAKLTDDWMDNLLKSVAENPEAIDTILVGWGAALVLRFDRVLLASDGGRTSVPDRASVLRKRDAHDVENVPADAGKVFDRILAGLYDEQTEQDEARGRVASLILGLPLLHPAVASHSVGAWAASELKNHVIATFEADRSSETSDLAGMARDHASAPSRIYAEALLRHGYLDPDVIALANEHSKRDEPKYASPYEIERVLIDNGEGVLVFDYENDAYFEWADGYLPNIAAYSELRAPFIG